MSIIKSNIEVCFRSILLVGLLVIVLLQLVHSDEAPLGDHKLITEIDSGMFKDIKMGDGYVGVVTVTGIEFIRPGTRSEMVKINVDVNNQIFGAINTNVKLMRYTSKKKSPLILGKKYVVVLKDITRFQPGFWLDTFQPVDCADCQEVVESCKSLLVDKQNN